MAKGTKNSLKRATNADPQNNYRDPSVFATEGDRVASETPTYAEQLEQQDEG